MANELYGHHHTHNPRYAPLPSYYASSRSLLTEPYVPSTSLLTSSSSTRYLSSTFSDPYLTSDRDFSAVSPAPSAAYEPHLTRTAVNLIAASRSAKAFYEQSVLGSHSLIGQSEAWLSTNLLAKRPRLEGTNNLPVYPQRPGEKDCAHYMLTRTCKFGDACRFDHPIWVPASGIPNWKEGQQSSGHSLSFPERPGEPDCPYFLRTSNCKYGHNCKFNHPKDKMVSLPQLTSEDTDASVLPERPSEPPCSYFLKTGKCKFGVNCKFNHPKDIHVPSIVSGTRMSGQFGSPKTDVIIKDVNQGQQLVAVPALHHNSKGLPIRLGEVDCPFYMKTGSCKYGAACRYSHPDRISTASNSAAMNHSGLTSPAFDLNLGLVNPAVSILRSLAPRLSQAMLGLDEVIYPQRPGEIECDHYMKTGGCKFGEKCKFNHPIDRSDPNAVILSFAGLPRREGAMHCAFYMKTGICKFGFRCKFDHPPPGEVMTVTEAPETNGKDDGNGEEGQAAPNVLDNLL